MQTDFHLPLPERLKKRLTLESVPLLYSISIVTAMLYYYMDNWVFLFLPVIVAEQWILFRFYNYVKRRPLLGGCFFMLLLFAAFLLEYMLLVFSNAIYDIEFYIWVLTPQGVLSFYPLYVLIMAIAISGFISSCVYYFTKVQYRVIVSFLMLIFPFAVFTRENSQMPLWMMLWLLILYYAVMVSSRQKEREMPKRTWQNRRPQARPILHRGRILQSAALFLSISIMLVMALPKPLIEADRTFLENALEDMSLTEKLMAAISQFTDSSNGGQEYVGDGDSRILYYVNSDDVINLKMRTFSNYNASEDRWYASDFDSMQAGADRINQKWENREVLRNPATLLDAVCEAAKLNPAFAESFELEPVITAWQADSAANYDRELLIASNNVPAELILTPTHAYHVEDYAGIWNGTGRTESGVLYKKLTSLNRTANDHYEVSYYSDSLAASEASRALQRSITKDDRWETFLYQLYSVLYDTDYKQVILQNNVDLLNADKYEKEQKGIIPARIQALTDSLLAENAADPTTLTDLEKAEILEAYLRDGDFTYDQYYVKADHADVETFLFEDRVGVCYEFASAMVLMCRAAGLPARYVEGYGIRVENTSANSAATYNGVIRGKDAHAFVEVYLRGYGWISMDPTTGHIRSTGNASRFRSLTLTEYIGITLLGATALAMLLYFSFRRRFAEWWFRKQFRKAKPGCGVTMLVARIKWMAQLSDCDTADELTVVLQTRFGVNWDDIVSLLEQFVYGGVEPTAAEAEQAFAAYLRIRDIIAEVRKKERKRERNRKHISKKVERRQLT